MATATKKTETETTVEEATTKAPEMRTYVVIADAINVTTGRKATNGQPEVVRMHRGETITAPADHQQVLEFLGMGGILDQATLLEDAKAIQKTGNGKSVAIQKTEDGTFRITATGVSKRMGAADDPVAEAKDEDLPIAPIEH